MNGKTGRTAEDPARGQADNRQRGKALVVLPGIGSPKNFPKRPIAYFQGLELAVGPQLVVSPELVEGSKDRKV
jgi:hypothetical protein